MRSSTGTSIWTSITSVVALALTAHGATVYVNAARPDDTGNGLSWSAAKQSLQAGLTAASSGDEIWVAAGTYKPSTPAGQLATFTMKDGVSLYGGFAGTETQRSERNPNPATNGTILSGDIGSVGVDTDNCYTVVTRFNVTATLDGFTVRDGRGIIYSTGSGISSGRSSGTSIFTVANCLITQNKGLRNAGGMNAGPGTVLTDDIFSYNETTADAYHLTAGGGLAIFTDTDTTVTRCKFQHNVATSVDSTGDAGGGGAYSKPLNHTVTFDNCEFTNNSAYTGGGLEIGTSSGGTTNTVLTNCLIADNTADASGGGITGGGGIFALNTVTISDCHIENNHADNTLRGGGGILSFATMSVERSRIISNTSSYGAAIAFWPASNRTMAVTNTLLAHNTSSASGALYVSGGTAGADLTLTNCTSAQNPTSGTYDIAFANQLYPATIHLKNSILWGCAANGTEIQPNSSITVTNCDVRNGWSGNGSNNLSTVDPLFRDPNGTDANVEDFALGDGSPCIGVGNNSLASGSYDLVGADRIRRGTVDLGAYESDRATVGLTGYCSTSGWSAYPQSLDYNTYAWRVVVVANPDTYCTCEGYEAGQIIGTLDYVWGTKPTASAGNQFVGMVDGDVEGGLADGYGAAIILNYAGQLESIYDELQSLCQSNPSVTAKFSPVVVMDQPLVHDDFAPDRWDICRSLGFEEQTCLFFD